MSSKLVFGFEDELKRICSHQSLLHQTLRCSGFLCHDFVLPCLSFSSHLIQQEIAFRNSVAAQETLSRVKSWWKWWIPQVRSADPKPVWGTTRSLSFTHISLSSQKDRLDSSTQTSSDGVPVSQRKVGRVWLNKHNSSSVFSTKYLSVAVMLSYGRTVVRWYTVKRIWMLNPHLKMCGCYCIKTVFWWL